MESRQQTSVWWTFRYELFITSIFKITYHIVHTWLQHIYNCKFIKASICQRENSPVTETIPEPTLLTWGGWPHRKKFSPLLATFPNQVLPHLSGHSDPMVLEPFDITLWYSGVPSLLKTSSDIERYFRNGFFSTLHTDLKVESHFHDHY